MDSISNLAIDAVENAQCAFCKFLAANDTKATNSHQSGILVPKITIEKMFGTGLIKNENVKRTIKIHWGNLDTSTDSTFTFYGKVKNEGRLTNFGRGFNLLNADNVGALFVMAKLSEDDYAGYVLEKEDDITSFLENFGLSPADTGNIISVEESYELTKDMLAQQMIIEYINNLNGEFPTAYEMSSAARNIQDTAYNHVGYIQNNPDLKLIQWISMEYDLFKNVEQGIYKDTLNAGFSDMQSFINLANSILNRRKSRAGKSLEYHLEALFAGNNLRYEAQVITEEKKRPDFVFLGGNEYHDLCFPADKLIVLGAKTTCKDRWRQVVTEADRVNTKYLCTLQQGISSNQLKEMRSQNVVLVVPKSYISCYPREYQSDIINIQTFIRMVKEKQKI